MTRHERGRVVWVDVESPTREELQFLLEEFAIDARIGEEVIAPTPYPLFIPFPDYVYLILHFPASLPEGGARNQEVDFIVGKRFLITVRYETIESIHNLHKIFEAEELLGLPAHPAKAAVLVERVMRRLHGAMRSEVEHAAHILERLEHDVFAGKERETVRTISETARVLLRFETALARHDEPLSAFLASLSGSSFFGKGFADHAVHLEAERGYLAALVASYRAAATELRDTNDSLLSASQNEIMKTLTVITFIAFPLSLIAALFQMGAADTPLVDKPGAFWIILGSMIVISGFLAFFIVRRKRWL